MVVLVVALEVVVELQVELGVGGGGGVGNWAFWWDWRWSWKGWCCCRRQGERWGGNIMQQWLEWDRELRENPGLNKGGLHFSPHALYNVYPHTHIHTLIDTLWVVSPSCSVAQLWKGKLNFTGTKPPDSPAVFRKMTKKKKKTASLCESKASLKPPSLHSSSSPAFHPRLSYPLSLLPLPLLLHLCFTVGE